MVGGVATSNGDFRWTKIVDRCLVAGEAAEAVGEKAAAVGRFDSSFVLPDAWSGGCAGEDDISAIHGVSASYISHNNRNGEQDAM